MAYRLPPLSALRAFESAARHLSFKKAADELHVTPAAVSQQIKALESYLDMPLFRRLPRSQELTAEAQAMLPKIREGFDCLAAAVAISRSNRGGTLHVSAPPSLAARWLVPRLSRFSAAHPEVELRLSSSLDNIDAQDAPLALKQELLDPRDDHNELAIRFGTGRYPGYRVEQLLAPDYVLVCSPRLLSGPTPLLTPDDLRHQVLIHDESIADASVRPNWREWLRLARVSEVDASRGPRFSNTVLALEAVLDGQGVALVLQPLVTADVAAGRLVIPFAIPAPSAYAYFLVIPEALADRLPVVAFRAWLLEELARSPG